MRLQPHSPEWYDRLATLQRGYYYPWQSRVAPRNGEDAYLALLGEHLAPDKDVLDIGCGHGTVALDIAPRCRSVLAYDRVPSYIALAREEARRRGAGNVAFVCAGSAPEVNGGRARIPAGDGSFDVLTSRRGPLHWIEDARRVARPGAVLIQLNPDEVPAPWDAELPAELRQTPPGSPPQDPAVFAMRPAVDRRLASAGLHLRSCWTFDVPEYFADPEQLYVRLTFGRTADEAPAYDTVREQLEGLFARHATRQGLVLRHRRFLWMAVVE